MKRIPYIVTLILIFIGVMWGLPVMAYYWNKWDCYWGNHYACKEPTSPESRKPANR